MLVSIACGKRRIHGYKRRLGRLRGRKSSYRYGMPALRCLAEGGHSPKVDIIAVHGLNWKGKDIKKHAWDTWRPSGEGQGKLWLRDVLPESLPEARIFLYEYDSSVFSGKHDTFWDAANELLDCIRGKRRVEPRRPIILVGHSLGGLLIKQALVNAHDNSHYADVELSVKGLVFFGTPHEGGNVALAKVNLGLTAAKIARNLGFSANDSVVQVLMPGSLFGDFLREAFRHQLENYLIVSFWEKKDTIVTKESATFGLPGHRETILGLEADHTHMCKFDTDIEHQRDIYEIVENNFYWLYEEALKELALQERLEALGTADQLGLQQKEFEDLSHFSESTMAWVDHLTTTLLDDEADSSLDWLVHAPSYLTWRTPPPIKTSKPKQVSAIWLRTDDADQINTAFGSRLLEDGATVIHVKENHPLVSSSRIFRGLGCTERVVSALLCILHQTYILSSDNQDFPTYLIENDIFKHKPGSSFRDTVARSLVPLLTQPDDKRWTIFIHDVDLLASDVVIEIDKLVTKLLRSSRLGVEDIRIAAMGSEPKRMPQLAQYATVIHNKTEYFECLDSLRFENMNIRRDRIVSAAVGTNHWVWSNPGFSSWQTRSSAAIWICGKAGSGKSVLAKTLQSGLSTQAGGEPLVCSWFYSARDNLTLHGQMFSAVLFQLLSQEIELFRLVKNIYREWLALPAGQQPNWPIQSLKRALSEIFTQPVDVMHAAVIVLDGLDEGNAHDSGNDCSRRDALAFILGLTSAALPLKIIFLSRPSDDIKKVLKRQLFISMHTVNRPDIVLLIQNGVEALASALDGRDSDGECSPAQSSVDSPSALFKSAPNDNISAEYFATADLTKMEILSDIYEYLNEHARGVVLWVTTVISILRRRCQEPLCDIESLKDELENLPLELTDLYSRTVSSLLQSFNGNKGTLDKARQALMWVSVSSKHRLQLQDLLEILSHDFAGNGTAGRSTVFAGVSGWATFKQKIEMLCGPFIDIIPILSRTDDAKDPEPTQWDLLQLPHDTVRTFLQKDERSFPLGFSSAEAEQMVHLQRRKYMNRTLPYLEPLLLSSQYTQTDPPKYCDYFESRPLLCFILTTLEIELSRIISQPSGKMQIANILNIYNTSCERKGIEGQRNWTRDTRLKTQQRPLTWTFPFLTASALLRTCDFIQFADPSPVAGEQTRLVEDRGGDLLEQLFYYACSRGQLNAINAICSLLLYPQPVDLSIRCGMKDAAIEGKLFLDYWAIRASRPRCFRHEYRGRITHSIRTQAAISQVFDHQIFYGGSVGFWTILAQLEASSMPMAWAKSRSYQALLRSLKSHDDCSVYRRTPFTRLYPPP